MRRNWRNPRGKNPGNIIGINSNRGLEFLVCDGLMANDWRAKRGGHEGEQRLNKCLASGTRSNIWKAGIFTDRKTTSYVCLCASPPFPSILFRYNGTEPIADSFSFFFSFFFSLSLADVRAHVYQSNEATTRSVARPRPNGNAFHGFSGRDASILAPWLEICRPTVIPYTPWPDQRSITNPTPTDSPHFLSDRRSSPSRG